MLKRYVVHLSADERIQLEALIHTGNAPASTQTHARILLKADCSADGPVWTDERIAEACEVSRPTVERLRKTFATKGLEAALYRKKWTGPSRRKLDGKGEAQLVALACGDPPDGADRWTLVLLADKLVALGVVDAIAPDTVRLVLKKTNLSRG
jgi:homeodomain-containing protein